MLLSNWYYPITYNFRETVDPKHRHKRHMGPDNALWGIGPHAPGAVTMHSPPTSPETGFRLILVHLKKFLKTPRQYLKVFWKHNDWQMPDQAKVAWIRQTTGHWPQPIIVVNQTLWNNFLNLAPVVDSAEWILNLTSKKLTYVPIGAHYENLRWSRCRY